MSRGEPVCPRCARALHPPGVWSSAWRCDLHGEVVPLQPSLAPGAEQLASVASRAEVPVWVPWPLPIGWLVTGVRYAGEDRGPARAVATACSGPGLLGGPVDLVLVAEEPGIGLGAHYAGLSSTDPGPDIARLPSDTKVSAAGHPTPLWSVPLPEDRSVYVGEAAGLWLWLVVWPVGEWMVVHDELTLVDLRAPGHGLDVPFGAPTPRLAS